MNSTIAGTMRGGMNSRSRLAVAGVVHARERAGLLPGAGAAAPQRDAEGAVVDDGDRVAGGGIDLEAAGGHGQASEITFVLFDR